MLFNLLKYRGIYHSLPSLDEETHAYQMICNRYMKV